jgi:chromosome segregation ATPase
VPNKDKENPTQKRRQELIAQANEIRSKQGVGKADRTGKMSQIKQLDEQLRRRITEQKAARSKMPYKNTAEIDDKIKELEASVDSGKMKLVDEKKALAEVSNLRKIRKNFSTFDNEQTAIDDLRAKIKEIKDSMENPEAKALSAQYDTVQAELDTIKAEQDSVYKNLSSLRKERDELRNKQQATWEALKKFKDNYYTQRKAAQQWERQQWEKRREREQADRDRINKERKMERAQQMLAEASDPSFAEQIRRADNLARFFDPSHAVEEKAPLLADKGLAAAAQRKVDAGAFEGMKLVRKEDRADEYLPASKKGKKGKKSHAATDAPAAAGKFSCPPSVMEDCTFVGVNPPMSAAEVPEVLEKVKAKIAQWKADQTEQTRKVCFFKFTAHFWISSTNPFAEH